MQTILLIPCIRYVPSTSDKVSSSFLANPQTGEIINASVFVPANVGNQIYRWLFLGSAASDASMRTSHLPQDKFNQGLKYLVAREVGRSLGLLDNIGASYSYPVDSLRNSTFTRANNLAASIMLTHLLTMLLNRAIRVLSICPRISDSMTSMPLNGLIVTLTQQRQV